MQKNKPTLSVIITALNEEDNIVFVINNILNAFERFKINGEVIVVNDGSTDNTKKLVESFIEKDERIKLINHKTPQGVGKSFWDGVDFSKSEVVVWFPADNENDPNEILIYYDLINEVDLVLPFIFNKEVRPFLRHFLSFVYRFIINTTFLSSFNYTNGTSLYRKCVLERLNRRDYGFFFQTDIVVRASKMGYLFAEVPCKLNPKDKKTSRAISIKSFLSVIKGYLRLFFDFYIFYRIRKEKEFPFNSATRLRRLNDKR